MITCIQAHTSGRANTMGRKFQTPDDYYQMFHQHLSGQVGVILHFGQISLLVHSIFHIWQQSPSSILYPLKTVTSHKLLGHKDLYSTRTCTYYLLAVTHSHICVSAASPLHTALGIVPRPSGLEDIGPVQLVHTWHHDESSKLFSRQVGKIILSINAIWSMHMQHI